ncbi:SDR family oxidoreductase [Leucobacter albus]|uniref:SDR family oxidoreductase n=1 Tax=Leucobacter albus TaxID=272210 RepID=A0ABW3TIJ2_9MICO
MRIAVAGSTGTVGAHVMREALQAGHDVLGLARRPGGDGHPGGLREPLPDATTGRLTTLPVDLTTAAGLDLSGVDAVIDVSASPKLSGSEAFFGAVTEHLLRAAAAAGVQHYVALSIVGAAQHPYGYYAGKALQERLVSEGETPWTVLRATQFFEFADQSSFSLGPWTVMPKMRSQPVAASSVARRLVELASGPPRGFAGELAGPDELWMADLGRMVLETHGLSQTVIELPLPGKFGRAIRTGGCLPGPGAEIDSVSYEDWLAEGAR